MDEQWTKLTADDMRSALVNGVPGKLTRQIRQQCRIVRSTGAVPLRYRQHGPSKPIRVHVHSMLLVHQKGKRALKRYGEDGCKSRIMTNAGAIRVLMILMFVTIYDWVSNCHNLFSRKMNSMSLKNLFLIRMATGELIPFIFSIHYFFRFQQEHNLSLAIISSGLSVSLSLFW